MHKRLVSIALGVLAIPVLGSIAYAAAHSVSDRPAPQVIIPASVTAVKGGADDPATHEANHLAGDDNPAAGQSATTTPGRGRGADDTAPGTTATTVDATATTVGHDVGDDHGGGPGPTSATTVAGHDAGDDRGTNSGGGPGPSTSSGPGTSGSNSGRDSGASGRDGGGPG